jgi:nucleoside-diphosphate-sugar epimerase
MTPTDKIFVAGHQGLMGSALCEVLSTRGYHRVVTRTRAELDLRDAGAVLRFYEQERPDVVFDAAARVGGIHANSSQGADFLYDNLQIQNSVIWGAHRTGVRRLMFLGSSCIYPRDAAQPMLETALLTGPLEITNRPYAIAKIAGLELVQTLRQQYGRDYFSVMPTNLYGPRDRFHPMGSHVIPGLIRRFVEARRTGQPEVVVWGTGSPKREFLHARDCAEATIFLAERLDSATLAQSYVGRAGFSHINVGSNEEVTIAEVARLIGEAVGYPGVLRFDPSMPDGSPRKLMDSSLLRQLGWKPQISLRDGLKEAVAWFESVESPVAS